MIESVKVLRSIINRKTAFQEYFVTLKLRLAIFDLGPKRYLFTF